MRRAGLAFGAVLVAGLVALVAVGLTQRSSLVYALGATPTGPAVELRPGQEACQAPVAVPGGEAFDAVAFTLDTGGRPGPAVDVRVLDDASERALGRGALAAGYPARAEHVVGVGRIEPPGPVRLCLANEGPGGVTVLGQLGAASPTTTASIDGQPVDVDLALFLRGEERSLLGLLPAMAERAARFRAGWVTPVVYGGLGVLVLAGAPLLLARGLGRAARADEERRPDPLG